MSVGHGLTTTFSKEHLSKVALYKWWVTTLNGKFYAVTVIIKNGNRSLLFMHHVIYNAPKGVVISHLDSEDTLNNTNGNIQFVPIKRERLHGKKMSMAVADVAARDDETFHFIDDNDEEDETGVVENIEIIPKDEKKSTHDLQVRSESNARYLGICWVERLNNWRVSIEINGKLIHLRYFKENEDLLARIYLAKAEIYFYGLNGTAKQVDFLLKHEQFPVRCSNVKAYFAYLFAHIKINE